MVTWRNNKGEIIHTDDQAPPDPDALKEHEMKKREHREEMMERIKSFTRRVDKQSTVNAISSAVDEILNKDKNSK